MTKRNNCIQLLHSDKICIFRQSSDMANTTHCLASKNKFNFTNRKHTRCFTNKANIIFLCKRLLCELWSKIIVKISICICAFSLKKEKGHYFEILMKKKSEKVWMINVSKLLLTLFLLMSSIALWKLSQRSFCLNVVKD